MNHNKFSFIVPIYNSELTIGRCINSILSQSYTNIELLLIDDGYTDNTKSICDTFLNKDSRVKYYYKQNSGVSSARNLGLSLSTGDYISFVDADDYIESTYCELFLNVFEKYDVDIVYGKPRDIYDDRVVVNSNNSNQIDVYNSNNFEFYGSRNHEVVWGAAYKKNVLLNLNFNETIYIGEDTLFFSQAIHNSNSVAVIDAIIYNYVIHSNSALHSSDFNDKKITHIDAFNSICDIFKDNNFSFLSAKTKYVSVCLETLLKFNNNSEFVKKYKTKTIKEYRKNIKYLIKYYFMKKRFKSIVKHFLFFIFIRPILYFKSS